MTLPLWTADELVDATGGYLSAPFDATGVSIDTRTLAAGDLFVALVGEGRDGHAFVANAQAAGAAGAMVHQDAGSGLPVLHVDDTLAALARLGGFARARFGDGDAGGRLVAVTGSVGKTTTKEMLRVALSVFGPAHAAAASYNNHWGLPLTLARTPRAAKFCIAEIGMNHAGEIEPLARLARPHVGVITTIAKAHVGHLGSIEAIADEKACIMRGLERGGIAVLPVDSPLFPRLRAASGKTSVMTFGADPAADVRLVDVEADADGSLLHVNIVGHTTSLRLKAPGRHMAMNAVATLAAVVALGLDPTNAVTALETFAPVAGRGVRREISLAGGTALLLDESYNGNGASMRAALDVLRLQPARRRIAVLGDMLELGDEGPPEHAALADAVNQSADLLFTCGPLMRNLFDAIPASRRGAHAADSGALAPIVASFITPGDAILVKGSLGSGMRRVIEAIGAVTSRPSTVTAGAG
ncbi:UDP-N-acetylmuramoyl-tripeptide--D-alanyl-D-alanine ligase [Rhodopila globiformis]|uniref:UDP-N-acetylmuramoyl-tripeptide--D-alanyl-D-alanine ligase n=1 Tax=Rhodopila globiformis TaxID=1071 RepID=A0A2S6MWT0_RHOGL|nr:UDP-N-acetylmuramoyl-tripeptide--D-alanyl-D-alanine ligase [Rhodopila globiformis]PPQ26822.1 UDP-N-acetylmuramoyl-tripeptide--D-alanyl-D-alanine ligase [Rhodopila globiformis]